MPGTIRSTSDLAEFKRLVGLLREKLPADREVRVRRKAMELDLAGLCQQRRRFYLITINNRLNIARQLEILVHEWAHARAWQKQECHMSDRDHDKHWALEHGKCWNVYEDLLTELNGDREA